MNRRRRKKLQRQLLAAAGWGTAERVARLVRAGADPDRPDRDGTTPLYRASVQGRAENVRVLTAAGAGPDRESGTGDEGLPLCGAACWGHVAAVRELLAAGADPWLREDGGRGRTAGEWAAAGGHHEVLALINATARPGAARRTPSGAVDRRPLLTETVQIPTPDGTADALVAYPGDGGRHPGVLMYADGFGLRPTVRDMAVTLAGHGYHVLVPNFFYRHGPAPVIDLPEHIGAQARPAIFAELMPMIEAHSTERVLSDAGAYLRFLTARPGVAAGPVAVTGYCIGGLLAIRTAAAHPAQVAAVAGFHCPVGAAGPEVLARVTAEAHFGHAAGDLTPEALATLNDTLDAAGLRHTSEIYPGTVHGFTMADTDSFDAAARQRHWDRLLPLLRRSLATG